MQFSIQSIILAVIITAIICAVSFVAPAYMSFQLVLVLLLMVTSFLISVIVYDRGYGRAFAIGAVAFLGISAVLLNSTFISTAGSVFPWGLLMAVASGGFSMLAYRASLDGQSVSVDGTGKTGESVVQPRPTQLARLTSGLALGLLMGGAITIAAQLMAPAPLPIAPTAFYPTNYLNVPSYSPISVIPPPISYPAPVFPSPSVPTLPPASSLPTINPTPVKTLDETFDER